MANFATVTDEILQNPDPADWLHLGGNYEHWNYSELDQINLDNIGDLRMVWARQMVAGGRAEVSPIIYKGVMFLPNPYDTLQAIDAATGSLIWEYERAGMPEVGGRDDEGMIRHTYSDRKRGIAIYGDTIIMTGSDNSVFAIDARSGQLVWENIRSTDGWPTSTTGAVVADGRVFLGGSCQNAPINCYVTGHDVATGEELWRNEVVPGPGEPGDETWGGVAFENRYCTGVWGQLVYDPEQDLLHYGSTGVCPAPDVQRGVAGMNATLAGTNERWAVRPDTGEVVWRHQIIAQDNWDQECTFDMMLVDTPMHPNANMEGALAVNPTVSYDSVRTLVGMPCKNPVYWAFAAETGEFFYARETFEGAQNIYDTIDPTTGQVAMNQAVIFTQPGQSLFFCTTYGGGRDWPSGAYDPTTNTMFQPTANLCTDSTSRTDREPAPGFNYNTNNIDRPNPNVQEINGEYPVGRITAVNVETGDTAWQYLQRSDNYAPVLATAGGLLFNGDGARYFFALNKDTGEKVWDVRLSSALGGYPVTYSVDGRQYVAIAAGYGRNRLTPELDGPTGGNTIYVFALPE
ncbi:MAG: PQQ-binding-like beta-propeller repeat protein [Bauldia sp.]|nr:PQQ-binding-like beta-propeller repeat protein [Bauldia sp.]